VAAVFMDYDWGIRVVDGCLLFVFMCLIGIAILTSMSTVSSASFYDDNCPGPARAFKRPQRFPY
jgi:hypothetical protein